MSSSNAVSRRAVYQHGGSSVANVSVVCWRPAAYLQCIIAPAHNRAICNGSGVAVAYSGSETGGSIISMSNGIWQHQRKRIESGGSVSAAYGSHQHLIKAAA